MTNNVWRNFAAEWRDFLASATPDRIEGFLASLAPGEASRLVHAWPLWARSSQLPPPGDWRVWLLMAGRGFGKTRAGAEWVRGLAGSGAARSVALVGDTAEDVRQVMIEGPSGVLAVTPAASRPIWHRSLRRLDWPSGMVARCFSAADPEQLRGPEFDHAWADEIGKWPYEAAWDNLMLALRAGQKPRCLATTTPRPRRWLRDLAAAPDTVVVRGASKENEANLAPRFIAAMEARYGHGALARQELRGEMIEESPGALWTRRNIEAARAAAPPRTALQRNWRPITMLSFLGLVIADSFGLLAFRLADQAWLLLQIGLGGYVVGRSVEKISPQITAIAGAAPPRPRQKARQKAVGKAGPKQAASSPHVTSG